MKLKEKEAIQKIIYIILKEFIEADVIRELEGWARKGVSAAKLEIILKILEMSGNN